MSFSLHTIKESLPSVLPGHVVTPSTASRDRQRSSSIFDAVGLALKPTEVEGEYVLSVEQQRKTEWNFSFNWPRQTGDDKVLEKTSYAPVLDFLRGLGLLAEDVSEGANCVEKRCTILISSHAGKKIQSKCEDSESIIDIVCKAVPILLSLTKVDNEEKSSATWYVLLLKLKQQAATCNQRTAVCLRHSCNSLAPMRSTRTTARLWYSPIWRRHILFFISLTTMMVGVILSKSKNATGFQPPSISRYRNLLTTQSRLSSHAQPLTSRVSARLVDMAAEQLWTAV